MKLSRLIVSPLVLATALTLSACKKGPALEELKKVEQACDAKDEKQALDIALKACESNSSFKKAFDQVFSSVPDKTNANVCGGTNLSEMKMRIENGPAI